MDAGAAGAVALSGERIWVRQHDSPLGRWELARGLPDTRLARYVIRYEGYEESRPSPVRRREVPNGVVTVILTLGPGFRVLWPNERGRGTTHRSFVAGLSDVPALVDSDGVSSCLQIDLTPLGARRFFGVELAGLSNCVVALDDVLGAPGRELVDRLYDAADWATRFAILDRAIATRITGTPPPDGDLAWAWRRIHDCAGVLGIAALATEIGCSRKHLTTRFTREIGLPPKTVARIERFQRAVRLIEGEAAPQGAELALACGYFDQAHFVNDFRALSGLPPGEYRRRVVPGGGVLEPR